MYLPDYTVYVVGRENWSGGGALMANKECFQRVTMVVKEVRAPCEQLLLRINKIKSKN